MKNLLKILKRLNSPYAPAASALLACAALGFSMHGGRDGAEQMEPPHCQAIPLVGEPPEGMAPARAPAEPKAKRQAGLGRYNGFSFPDELDTILYTARRVGVDPAIMLAIRESEKGGDGLQFGIMPTDAYSNDTVVREGNGAERAYDSKLEKQASWAAWTIRAEYTDFIDFLGDSYCPVGAENDRHGLNVNWEGNVRNWYDKFANPPQRCGGNR
jgi:hypothetical protein